MLESNNPDINIADLQEKVEKELKAQKEKRVENQGNTAPGELKINDPYSWAQMSDTLKMAGLNVNAGAEVTSMLHHRGVVRKVARLVGKVVIYLGRVITIPQRNFNASILHCLHIMLDGIRDMNRQTALQERQLRLIEEKSAQIDYLKSSLAALERQMARMTEGVRSQTANPVQGSEAVAVANGGGTPTGRLDSLYLAFEDTFRGSREDIRARLLEYLPMVRQSGAGREGREVLDIGCGRGEWLEIMKDEQLLAKGVDINQVFVQECREKGLAAEESDAITYLHSLPDKSIGGITAFHLIEHLGFEERIVLFDECARVLKSGGFALFETPNPRNLLIGACNFWADPTHLRPLYPETHKFLMEYRGFRSVELMFLHPHEGEQRLPEEEAPELGARLNELLSCERDYAILGYKP